jgi:hypothetical protein
MNVEFIIGRLKNKQDWENLAEALGGTGSRVVRSIIRHLITINVDSYLIESRYIDRDYSSDYRRFYAQTFRTYDRHCKRVHFFAEDVASIIGKPKWTERQQVLQATSKRSYLGFCVVRPLPGAPIGRTVLRAAGPQLAGLESAVTCRAEARANLLGAELDVVGTSFMQQDSRVGACAQVAIWAGARHMHLRHKYDWLSVTDITRLAQPTTSEEATSLPAGSDFLTSERMIRAINEMGFQPLCFENADIGAAILPYVESGLPVILGLHHKQSLGHAVTVIGRVFAQRSTPSSDAIDYVPAFIVHDDQAGPYMLVPTDSTMATRHKFDPNQIVSHRFLGNTSVALNVSDHAVFAVALMPQRVFSTAAEALHTTRKRIDALVADMAGIRAALKTRGAAVNDRLLDELALAHKQKKLVLRTYLTSASGYRRHIAQGTACNELKDVLLRLHLPHFTWVTEISTADSYNHSSPGMRRMYGHAVLDATSTGKDTAGLLMLHLPGIAFVRTVDAKSDEQHERAIVINNDALYECREKRFDH